MNSLSPFARAALVAAALVTAGAIVSARAPIGSPLPVVSPAPDAREYIVHWPTGSAAANASRAACWYSGSGSIVVSTPSSAIPAKSHRPDTPTPVPTTSTAPTAPGPAPAAG